MGHLASENPVGLALINAYQCKFVYSGWNLVAELDGGGNPIHSFVWGNDASGTMQGAGGIGGLLAMVLHQGANAGTYFYCYDGSYRVVALVNTSGQVVAEYEYGPFLELLRVSGPLARENPFLGTTKYYDWETGLYYYGYRYYSPEMARWLSRDPLMEAGGVNVYSYCGNDPINRLDPLGLEDFLTFQRDLSPPEIAAMGQASAALFVGGSRGLVDMGIELIPVAFSATATGNPFQMGKFLQDLYQNASDSFFDRHTPAEPDLINIYATSYTAGGLLPCLAPGGGARSAGTGLLTKFQTWATTKAPILGKDIGKALVGKFSSSMGNFPYRFNPCRLYCGIPLPEKVAAKNVTKEIKVRPTPGRDGATSTHIIERVDGQVNSVTHQVTKDGKVLHQHQTHVGKYGTERRFPNEWIEYPTIPKE